MSYVLSQELQKMLALADTPSICNAIEVAQGKRGFNQFTKKQVQAADPELPAIFGFAKTAQIRATRPSDEAPDIVRQRRMAYYRYMSEAPTPRVCVIEDLDGDSAVGAFWGEVNTNVHQGLGVAGTLTNGLMRDLGDLAENYQVLAGGVGPSHAFVHVVEIDTPVTLFGLKVKPNDFVHADRHGAVIIPDEVLPRLPEALEKMRHSERLVLDPARRQDFDFEKFEAAWTAFENSRV